MEFVKKQAVERLERYHQVYSSDPNSLFELVITTYYAEIGLVYPCGHVGSFDDGKRIALAAQGKIEIKNDKVWHRVEMHLCEGIGFGLQYPELTWNLVSRQHSPVDVNDGDWKEFFHYSGLTMPKRLATDSPQQAESNVIGMVKGYIQQYRPELTKMLNLLQR